MGRKRVYDKIILDIFQQHKLRKLRFKEIREYLKEAGHETNDMTLSNNLDYLRKKGLILKFDENLYCLIEWAGTIGTNALLNLMYDLRDKHPKGSKMWKINHGILYQFLKGLGQIKILSEKERKLEKIIKSGLIKNVNLEEVEH